MHGAVRLPTRQACFVALAIGLLVDSSAFAASSLRVWGEPGEWMTGGATLSFESPLAFTFSQPLGGFTCSAGSPAFSIRFRGPTSHPLSPGTYGPLVYSPSDNESMIDEGYRTSGCRPASGSFQVRKLAFAPNGAVRQAWITWTAKCSATGPSQFGELRVNADTALWQSLPADAWCFGGDSAAFDVRAFDAESRPVTFQASGLPTGATFVDLGGGNARFRWQTATTSAAQVVPVTIIASNDAGVSDTTISRVHVVPYAMLKVSSDPGDPLGGGQPSAFLGPETAIQIAEHQLNLGLQLTWLSQSQRWSFALVAPYSRRLEPGVYEGSLRAPFQPTMLPGLSVSAATSCNTETGRFTVRRLARNAQGSVTGIWATVEDHCNGIVPKVLCEMRYNIDTTLYVQAPADVNVEVGTPVNFSVAAIGTRGRPLNLEASGLPAGATFTPIGTDAGSLNWVAPSSSGETEVRFVATDDQSGRAEVTTRIHVSLPARYILKTASNDCQVRDQSIVLTQLTNDFVPLPRYPTEAWVRTRGATSSELNVRAPFGFDLRKGIYPVGSYEYTGADRIFGYMTHYLNSQGYSNNLGSFHIRKLRIDADGFARSLWATWQGGCSAPPTTTGSLILNADTSLYLSAPAIAMVERGRKLQFDVSGTSATGSPVQLSCPQYPPGATFTFGSPGNATLSWPAAVPEGNVIATFIGSDPAGNADTLNTLIRVMKPQLMVVNGPPSHWTTVGGRTRLDATNANFYAPNPGVVNLLCYAIGRTWEFQVTAPFDRRLTPGLYVGGPRLMIGQPTRVPTIRVLSGNNATAAESVYFHVRKVAFGADGRPTQLWMPFSIKDWAGRVTGELRFGDPDTALYLSTPADLYANPASPMTFTARAVHAEGRPVALSARGLPPDASFQDQGDGTGSFTWPSSTGENTIIPVTVIAADDQGRQDTCVTHLHVVVPASLQTVRDPNILGDSWAQTSSTDATQSDFILRPYITRGVHLQVVSSTRDWWLYFDAPNDDFLTRRTYDLAMGVYDRTLAQPLLGILSSGLGCFYGARGTFTVLDVAYDASGRVATFWATFKDSCSQRGAISGEVRYGTITGVVATLASRLLASGENGMARLKWRVTSNGATLRLERRDTNRAEWRELATPAPDGLGTVSYEDREVVAGETYDYRLSSMAGIVLDEVTVTIKPETDFRIVSVGPNPASRTLILYTAGRSDGPLRLSVMDIAGRLIWSELRPAATVVNSTLSLQLQGSLPPGVYILRAAWSSNRTERRFAVVQ